MRRSFPSFGLRFRLMGLVLLAMLPMVGLLIFHAIEDRNQNLSAMQAEAVRIADLSAGSVRQVIKGTRHLLFLLACSEPIRTGNVQVCDDLLREWLEHSVNSYYNIGLAKSHEENIASAVPITGNFVNQERSWLSRIQQQRSFCIGEFQISRVSNRPTIVLACPLPEQPDDQPIAAVYAALNLDLLQSCISQPRLSQKTIIAILDRNGIELARNPDPEKWIGHPAKSWPLFQKKGGGGGQFVETAGVDGVVRLYTRVPVPDSDNGLFVNVGVVKEPLMAKVRKDFLRNMGWLGLIAMIGIICTRLVADVSVLKHVHRLTDAAQKLTAGHWETEARLYGGARELQQLSHAFDEMAATLRRQRDGLEEQVAERTRQLSRVNESLMERIAERMAAENTAQKHLTELQRSNKELEQFAYVASHDLQEPLRLVSAYTQLLLQRYQGKLDADAVPIVHFITDGVTRMQQLIQDLLAFSRVSSHSKPFMQQDLEPLFESVLRNLTLAINDHCACVTHDPLPSLRCDASQIAQLFQNLIANGIKFHGAESPRIHVGASKTSDGAAWLFSVQDNGIGIEPEYFERIFVIFQRLHSRSKYPGTGIGLAICKRIVEQHGGTMWVKSIKGAGSTFYFTIPANPETK